MFLTFFEELKELYELQRRNPLKSGQCFLLENFYEDGGYSYAIVAIPSNRVNVSYFNSNDNNSLVSFAPSRNPLKSGQCFLHFL